MQNQRKIQEKFLYQVWQDQNFSSNLVTSGGRQVQVIDPGSQNRENDGPDFRNARIKIGNITFTGDIEIDNFQSDWKLHGHNFNNKYNKVILHVIFQDENQNNSVYTRDGRKIPSIGIGKFIEHSMRESIQKAIRTEKNERLNKIPCMEVSGNIDEKIKSDYILNMGVERYRKKCERILHRLKELVLLKELKLKEPVVNYDMEKELDQRKLSYHDFSDKEIWEQLFYELIFEALGYTNNKDIMKKLARSVDIGFLKSLGDSGDPEDIYEAVFFTVSGLLPDYKSLKSEEVSVYARELYDNWEKVKKHYDGRTFYASHWHFAKLRPPNFPTVRIAGGVRILRKIIREDLIGEMFRKFEESHGLGQMTRYLRNNLIVKGTGFWKNHFRFDSDSKPVIKYFVGLSRSDDIIINVIFPVASVYFEIFGKAEAARKVFRYYTSFNQVSENRLVGELSAALRLNGSQNKSVMHQGMINLYRNYCSRDKCLDCEIGKRVFN